MFDSAGVEPSPGPRDRAPGDTLDELFDAVAHDELDTELQRLLDDEPVPGWADDTVPAPTYGNCDPSGFLALELDTGTADTAWLDDTTLIEAIVGFDRVASWAAARQARLLAELARRRPRDPVPNQDRTSVGSTFAPDEVGVALHLSRGTAAARIGMAQRLLKVLPDTHAAWEAGRIDLLKARAIDDATTVLSDEKAGEVEARVLPRAPEQTLAQLKAALARAVIAVDPDGAVERHRAARKDRRVCLGQENDGMASLWALLSAPEAAGAFEWLTRLARGLGTDDPRGIDARRADLMVALLTGQLVAGADITFTDDMPDGDNETTGSDAAGQNAAGLDAVGTDAAESGTTESSATESSAVGSDAAESSPAAGAGAGPTAGRAIRPVTPGKPLIQIVMAHSTLIGADDAPAELVGHGPIPAHVAREIAADGVWRRLVTDPLSGTLLDYGRITYTPPAGLADHVRARDLYCRAPGCRRRAADAELDHLIAWADGGTTCEKNLDAFCKHHHKLKHHGKWRIDAHPDGRLTWITPTGHRHTTARHDYRPEPPPAPAETAPSPEPDTPADSDPDPPPF